MLNYISFQKKKKKKTKGKNVFQHCPVTGMRKGDEALPSIILAGQALLVKMLITLEQHGIFGSNFVYLCILTLPSHWYAKW